MSQRFCSLIVLGPGAPNTFKFHLSRSAILILMLAFVVSFLLVVWAASAVVPGAPAESVPRTTLEAENLALRLENTNAAIGIQKLGAKVAELEAMSKHIDDLEGE
jgi:hypothetical protein